MKWLSSHPSSHSPSATSLSVSFFLALLPAVRSFQPAPAHRLKQKLQLAFPRLTQVSNFPELDTGNAGYKGVPTFAKGHRSPVFDPGYKLITLHNGDKVFRVSQRLQDFPPLTLVASFPALENGHIFPRLTFYDNI